MNKTRIRLIIYSLVIFLVSSVIYYFFHNIFFLIFIVAVGDLIFLALTILSKKASTVLAKAFRPILLLSLLLGYLLIFKQTSMTIFLIINFLFISLHSLLIYLEVKPDKLSIFENVITLILIFLLNNLVAVGLSLLDWPIEAVLPLSWLVNFVLVSYWAKKITKRPEVIAALWAIICVQLTLIMSNWLVLYQPISRIYISQIGIIILSLAYSLGGITIHQKNRNLTKNIIIEYLSVSLLVFLIIVILTRWTIAT